MNKIFANRDRWGQGYGLWVLVAMVFLIPPAWWAFKSIDLHNDVSNWLPQDDPQARTLQWFQGHFGSDAPILVSWDDSSITDPRLPKVITALRDEASGKTSSKSPYLKDVSSPIDALDRIVKSKVDPEEAVARLEGTIVGAGPLRIRLTDVGRQRLQTTRDKIQELVHSKFGVDALITEETEDDIASSEPLVLNVNDEDTVTIDPIRSDLQLTWPGMMAGGDVARAFCSQVKLLTANEDELIDECFIQAGSPIALIVTLSEAGAAERKEAIADLRERIVSVGVPEEAIHLGGSPVAGNELNQAVKKVAWNRDAEAGDLIHRSPLLVSCLVGMLLSVILLRSIRLVILVQVVAIYTMFLAVSLVPMTGGSMNMVLVVMPTLLMVLTISAAIHVVNYWKHASQIDEASAVQSAVATAQTPCILAAITTAIGLLSLASSPLAPVRDFGFYAAAGCCISVLVCLLGLPAMLQYFGQYKPNLQKQAGARKTWDMISRFIIQRRTMVTFVSLAVFAACSFGLARFKTQVKVIRYFPDDSRLAQDYDFLEQQLSGIIPVETVVRFDSQAQQEVPFLERQIIVQQVQDQIRRHPEISGVISLATFLPQPTVPDKSAGRAKRMMYRKRSSTTEQAVMDSEHDSVDSFFARVETAADLHAEGDNKLNAAGDELWRVTAQVAIQSDLDYEELTENVHRRASTVLRSTPGASHVVTGMVPVFLRTQQAVLESLITSFGLAFAVIALVMIFVLKNPVAGLLTMIPNLLPVGVVFGAVSWLGMRVDIGTMITASVALGIAVDGTLHLITWYRKKLAEGQSQHEAVQQALAHCGSALWQTSAVVGIGLLMLWPTELKLISRFGWVMAALIGAALVADLLLLPAMLAGPLGRLIQKTDDARRQRKAPSAPHEAISPPNVNRSSARTSQAATIE